MVRASPTPEIDSRVTRSTNLLTPAGTTHTPCPIYWRAKFGGVFCGLLWAPTFAAAASASLYAQVQKSMFLCVRSGDFTAFYVGEPVKTNTQEYLERNERGPKLVCSINRQSRQVSRRILNRTI